MSKRSKRQSKKPTIAVCVIAKNEEQFIGACLDSASPFVDELVVVDTGSTDRTVEIAKEHGARVEYFEWCDDFSAARNFAIDNATADWILMLDADEQLEPDSGPHLSEYAAHLPVGHCGYAIVIENRKINGAPDEVTRHAVTRFFPRRQSIRYVGAIHEDLLDVSGSGSSGAQAALQIRVAHYGYDPEVYAARAKDERNMQLLEAAHERDPHEARLVFYLGQQHFVSKRYAEACRHFQAVTERNDGTPRFWIVEAYRMWLDALIKLGDETGLAHIARQAEEANALSAVSRELLATHELQRGYPGFALRQLIAALSPDAPIGMTTPDGVGGWHTRLLLAQTYQALGETESVLTELDRVFADAPERRRPMIARNAAAYASANGRQTAALAWLQRATDFDSADLQFHRELLELKLRVLANCTEVPAPDEFGSIDAAIASRSWQAAYDAGMSLRLVGTATLARIVLLSQELREQGAPQAALNLLGRTIDTYPPSPAVYWPLIQVLKDLNRIDDALAAVEVLRQLESSKAA